MTISDLMLKKKEEDRIHVNYGVDQHIVIDGREYVWDAEMESYKSLSTEELIACQFTMSHEEDGWFMFGETIDTFRVTPIYIGLLDSHGYFKMRELLHSNPEKYTLHR